MQEKHESKETKGKRVKIIALIAGLVVIVATGLFIYTVSAGPAVQYYLLLGFDRFEERDPYYRLYRPDTIILCAVDSREEKIAVLSIPRDTKMEIAHAGVEDKINSAYYYGYDYGKGDDHEQRHAEGLRYTMDSIAAFLGVPINYYLELDMDDFVDIVDRLGGINYDVETVVREGLGRGRVLLEPGYQHLDGQHLLYYIHFRDPDPKTDLERTKRQQQILVSAFDQLRERSTLEDLPEIYRSIKGSLNTNLSTNQVVSLVNLGRKITMEDLKLYNFSGRYEYHLDEIPYFIVDEESRQKVMSEILGRPVEARD